MAKANGVNKRLLAKKDVNFFAEFTANAAKAARMMGYGIAAGFLVVFIVLGLIVAFLIRNTIIKAQIKAMKDLLAGPDYASLEQDAARLTEELNEMTNYYFALSQMRKDVDLIDAAPTDLPDVIAKCIPSDSYISEYTINSAELQIAGASFTYYSPVDMVNMLNDKDVFTARPYITVQRVDPAEAGLLDDMITDEYINVINNYYAFAISGTLVTNVHVSVSRFLDGAETATSLGGVETYDIKAGDSYSLDDIDSYTYGGVTYSLSRIFVDGIQVDDVSFSLIKESGSYTDVARNNADIKLYYAPVIEQQAAG
ncbi:MAG: hypothetical protein K6E12_07015 [Saccharofermentans sp.]|nr:hypothetical protein [Saccharofermentans sp.]